MHNEAQELASLAGGPRQIIKRATTLASSNPQLASHLADWAWYADSNDVEVVRGALQIYSQRVGKPLPTQEALVYAEHMARLQLKLNDLTATPAAASPKATSR